MRNRDARRECNGIFAHDAGLCVGNPRFAGHPKGSPFPSTSLVSVFPPGYHQSKSGSEPELLSGKTRLLFVGLFQSVVGSRVLMGRRCDGACGVAQYILEKPLAESAIG